MTSPFLANAATADMQAKYPEEQVIVLYFPKNLLISSSSYSKISVLPPSILGP
jgi:hypothetical protein